MRPIPSLSELSRVDQNRRANEFVEYARALALGENNETAAMHFAEASHAPPSVVRVFKTAIAGLVDDDSLAPLRLMAEGFSATLSSVGVFDALLPDMQPGLLHTRFAVATADATAFAVAAGAAKPLSKMVLTSGTLQERKIAAMAVLSNELIRFGSVGLVGRSLRNAVTRVTDSTFIGAMIALTTPIPASGLDAPGILHDLRLALDAIDIGDDSRLHIVMGAAVAARLAVMGAASGVAFPTMSANGGTLGSIPVHVSSSLTDSVLVLDASALVAASDSISVRTSSASAIKMSDAPGTSIATGSPLAPAAGTMVPLWQVNSTAILAERLIAFELIRASGAASLSGVQWALAGSPPA